MALPTNNEKQTEMFNVWLENQSIQRVARVCKVSHTTVLKYKCKNKWQKRLDKIREDAAEKVDAKASKRLANHLAYVAAGIKAWGASLTGQLKFNCHKCGASNTVVVPKVKSNLSDIGNLIHLQEELMEGKEGLDRPKLVKYLIKPPSENSENNV